jgi:hypothetical protein
MQILGFFSCSLNRVIGVLTGTALYLLIALGSVDITTMFSLPIHGQGMSFYILCPFHFLSDVVWFSL